LEERILIKELIDKNASNKSMCKILGRKEDSISQEIYKGGGRSAYCPYQSHKVNGRNKNQEVRLDVLCDLMEKALKCEIEPRRKWAHLSEDNKKKIIEMRPSYTLQKISHILKISPSTINSFLMNLDSKQKLIQSSSCTPDSDTQSRITSLEMQIEILFETIREIKNDLQDR